MKAVIYTRVSTAEQTTENQTLILTEWADRRKWLVLEIYQESDTAWKAGHQKELSRLMTAARKQKFDIVLVWSLDRLTREGPLAILSLIQKFKLYNVQVISYQESWTEAPGEIGELLYALTGWVARMESSRRSERTKAGMARSRSTGQHVGRPAGSKDKSKRKRRV